MCHVKNKYLGAVLFSVLMTSTGSVLADDMHNNHNGLPLYTISAYENEFKWRDPDYDFRRNEGTAAPSKTAAGHKKNTPPPDDLSLLTLNSYSDDSARKQDEEEDAIDEILENIPYSNSLKSTWKVLDGDVDLYVEGLRVDRGNKGLVYKTSTMPFMGEVEGVNIRAEVGEDNKVKLESSVIPFIGQVEGLKFKSSVGEDSAISVRYKISLDRLGL